MYYRRLFLFRPLLISALRGRNTLRKHLSPMNIQKCYSHDDTTQPYDNLPFRIKSRYSATLAFTFILGIGLWAPFFILWYQMAKRTM